MPTIFVHLPMISPDFRSDTANPTLIPNHNANCMNNVM